MNMKLFMGIIGICVVILAATGFLKAISDKYSSTDADLENMDGFKNTMKRLNETNIRANKTYTDLFGGDVKEEGVSILFTVTKMGWNAMLGMWENMNLFIAIIKDSFNVVLGEGGLIPGTATNWLLLSILSILFIAVIIWAVSALMKWYL